MPPQIHLIDETWIDCEARIVSNAVADPANWPVWWPGLTLTITRDRGLKGVQWSADGPFRGTVEIWLEPHRAGVILHHFLRLDPPGGERLSRAQAARRTRAFAWHAKRVFWVLKDELEAGRSASHPTDR
jgi:hypothetical protein